MGLYEVSLSVSLLGFGIGTMIANLHVWGIMFLLRAVLNILVWNASPRGPMCFRCLIFNLSGPCELLFLLCFRASWTWEVVSVMLYPCMLCVALLMCLLVLCVACWQCLWIVWWNNSQCVVAILLLNVMDVFSVCGGALMDRPCMVFQRVCVLCLWSQWASKYSFHMFVCVFVCPKWSPHLGVWELDHRCLLSLCYFFCVILHTMSLDKSLQLLCILHFGMLCLSAISMMFVKILLAVCMLVGMVVWAKADSVSSVNCVQSAFL